ncbi:MAG TPA: hypothetical protein PK675_01545 [Clostridia bacterium]|nr:hypothetical protein [Clostridia bacterium]
MPKSKIKNFEYFMNAETCRNPEFYLFDESEYYDFYRLEDESYE